MPRYTFVCKYVIGFDAEDEDEAYDLAYDSLAVDGWNHEATLIRGA